jgi:hypothetical protein
MTAKLAILQVSISKVSYLIVHLGAVLLFSQCTRGLPKRQMPREKHLGALMQSLRGLGVAFMQLTTMHWFVCAVTAMEAAIDWPKLVVVFSGAMALASAIRCGSSAAQL